MAGSVDGEPAARVIAVHIARDFAEVAAFLAAPAHMNAWASGLGQSLRQDQGEWWAQGPEGPVRIRFAPANTWGIADHWVELASGQEVYVPLRAIAHGAGCEVQLTLFRQPGMSAEKYAADADWVARDLARLKALLEGVLRA